MNWKKQYYRIRNHFGFSHTETKGFVLLLILIALIIAVPFGWSRWFTSDTSTYTTDKAHLDSLVAVLELKSVEGKKLSGKPFGKKPIFFHFDPNVIELKDWQRLGLPDYMAQRIINYRTKGGKFRVKADLKKIYGFPAELFTQLEPYIMLPHVVDKPAYGAYPFPKEGARYPSKELASRPTSFDLNMADTLQLKKIRGIGPALSKRIIKYRDRLGGFANVGQLNEVYGLDSAVVAEVLKYAFLNEDAGVKKIAINTATKDDLKQHPYISPRLATIIVAYRQQHGAFGTMDDLAKIKILDAATLQKLKPYIAF